MSPYTYTQVLAKRAIEELNAEDTPYPGYNNNNNNNNNNTIHVTHRFSDTANNIALKPSAAAAAAAASGGINSTHLSTGSTNTNTNTHTNTSTGPSSLGLLDDSAKLAHLLTTYNQTNTTTTTSTAPAGATTTSPATLFDNTTIHPLHTPHNTPHTNNNTLTNTNTNTTHNYGAIPITSSGTNSTNSSTSTTGSSTYMLSPSTTHSTTLHSTPFLTSPLPPLPGQSGAGSVQGGGDHGSSIGVGANSDFIDLESSTHALLTPSPPTCSKYSVSSFVPLRITLFHLHTVFQN